jgi:tellurite resistance protein TerC
VTVPAWVWAVSAAGLIALVTAEILLSGCSGRGTFPVRRAVRWVAVYVSLAVIFGLGVWAAAGWVAAGQFYAGYLTEYSLSLDNLFIFYVIMSWFAVPPARQQRVLLAGVGLALVLRSALILAGTAAVRGMAGCFTRWARSWSGPRSAWSPASQAMSRRNSTPG